MFKKILIAFDGSEGSRRALQKAIDISHCFEADLHAITVELELPSYVVAVGDLDEMKRRKDAYYEQLGQEARELAKAAGTSITPHVKSGHAVDKIVEFSKEGKFDLVVVGFTGHGRLFERIWGGTSRNIARFAPCAVLIVK